ncbi:MAG: hypothetical protein JZD40_00640 [Sulfolobus sp.]|nr:hypothetical protein [Sulfolobus sp.]
MKVNLVQLSFLSHETEDVNKILTALDELLGSYSSLAEKSITEATGHYGDKINLVQYQFKGKSSIDLFNIILNKMDKADIILMLSTFENRFANSKLYLRFDKQEIIVNKRLILKDGDDVIKVIVSIKGHPKEIKEELEKLASSRTLYTNT